MDKKAGKCLLCGEKAEYRYAGKLFCTCLVETLLKLGYSHPDLILLLI